MTRRVLGLAMALPFPWEQFREARHRQVRDAGEDLEVHYRWHPYFGRKVNVRRVEHRATGQFLKVLGPSGAVVSMAAWMLDPVVCASMTPGCATGRSESGGAKFGCD